MGFRPFGMPFGSAFGRGFGQGGGGASNPNAGYTLYDRFSTPLAAGSVNGTFADTGQARTVVDTNSKLSITGGQANFATGGVGAGDPGIWYPSITTVLGRLVMGQITPAVGNTSAAFGWDTDQTGALLDGFRLIGANTINALSGGGGISLALYTLGSAYTIAIIQRVNGFYYFIKGGSEFTNWTLLWVSSFGAAGVHFPSAGVFSGTSGIFTADNIRVPVTLYIPAPLCFDSFSR